MTQELNKAFSRAKLPVLYESADDICNSSVK